MDKTKRTIAYLKTECVIESCETIPQLVVAENMIENFKNMYGRNNEYTRALDALYMEKCDEMEYTPRYVQKESHV